MKTLFYQPSCGISGDMHLAAMIDLGVPEQHLKAELGRLCLDGQFSIGFESTSKMGISGTRARVEANDQSEHRHHASITSMIKEAGFSRRVENHALRIFQLIAEAESGIHNIPVEKVHFHEVGAIDSIIDIVGAAICLDWLDVERVICHSVEVGSGYVNCAHGRFPVPAPATQEILSGVPCTYGTVSGESTTPTGAAILKATVQEFCPAGIFSPERVGYGIGHKDFEIPNVLRTAIGESREKETDTDPFTGATTHYKIEANIDDMSAESFEPLVGDLLAAGAGDVFFTPIIMKKSRPATCFSVLCDQAHVKPLADMILNRSSTIGLRIIPFKKLVLPREMKQIETSYGPVTIKEVTQPDGRQRWKSEYDDVQRIATQAGVDFHTVKQRIDFEIQKFRDESS
jgi:pyridinium-3,5-bisthiocarboxylic acid mononucleotide nickel chelatase